jgi:hypothetical protein
MLEDFESTGRQVEATLLGIFHWQVLLAARTAVLISARRTWRYSRSSWKASRWEACSNVGAVSTIPTATLGSHHRDITLNHEHDVNDMYKCHVESRAPARTLPSPVSSRYLLVCLNHFWVVLTLWRLSNMRSGFENNNHIMAQGTFTGKVFLIIRPALIVCALAIYALPATSCSTSLITAISFSTSTCQFATAKRAAAFPSHCVPLT